MLTIIVQIIDESLWKNEVSEVKESLFFSHFLSFFFRSSFQMGAAVHQQPAACSATTNAPFGGVGGGGIKV